jgi:hypothetical protein
MWTVEIRISTSLCWPRGENGMTNEVVRVYVIWKCCRLWRLYNYNICSYVDMCQVRSALILIYLHFMLLQPTHGLLCTFFVWILEMSVLRSAVVLGKEHRDLLSIVPPADRTLTKISQSSRVCLSISKKCLFILLLCIFTGGFATYCINAVNTRYNYCFAR